MTDKMLLKMAVIAGASNALKIKEENPRMEDQKILQKINREVEGIITKLTE